MRKTANKTTTKAAQQIDQLLARIALDHLFIETLETQHSDRLDFHDVSVWGIKAALEAAYEAGRKYGVRVNTISAGPLKSRAASAIGKEPGQKTFIEYAIDYSKANSPLPQDLYSDDVGNSALFLCSPMARSITGVTLYVDNGLNCMGMALDSESMMAA